MLRRRAGGPRAAACDSAGGQRRASPRRLRTLTRAGHLAEAEELADFPEDSRAAEVLRHGIAVMTRGAFGYIFALAVMLGFFSIVNPAAELAEYGIEVPDGQNFTVIHVVIPADSMIYRFFQRCVRNATRAFSADPQLTPRRGRAAALRGRFHRDVRTTGQIIPGSPYPAKNHAGLFQFAPAGARQTQPLLAAGGHPNALNNTLTSYDTGSGVFQAVRARARPCKAGCVR